MSQDITVYIYIYKKFSKLKICKLYKIYIKIHWIHTVTPITIKILGKKEVLYILE